MNQPPPIAVWRQEKSGVCLKLLAAAGCLAVLAACGRQPAESSSDTLRVQTAQLQQRTTLLERQVQLATGTDFYLVLDPAAPALTLMLSGAELQRYPMLGLQVGQPRLTWRGRRDAREWRAVIWSHGELDPPRAVDRVVISGGADKAGEPPQPPPIPPTAEDLYPVPPSYVIRFAEGWSVEIRPHEADLRAGRWSRLRMFWSGQWRDAAAAMRLGGRDAVRLRVILNPKDAESLYRSLPPAVKLIVLSGGRRQVDAAPAESTMAKPAAGSR